ncbi:MAG: cupin domain-containing protein [Gemmatimonadota bacterium]
MSMYFRRVAEATAFSASRSTKADLFSGGQLFVGLNCFEPGQTQPIHAHAGADKFYFVVSGKARLTVGDETRLAEPGELVWAPADVPHGVIEVLERTTLLVGIAPPPKPKMV